ncbi:MAG: hypothetical protein M0Z62_08860 [Actinomycetota bacterium]|nr:hypothetical protein [Actinomycetota bacterium]
MTRWLRSLGAAVAMVGAVFGSIGVIAASPAPAGATALAGWSQQLNEPF